MRPQQSYEERATHHTAVTSHGQPLSQYVRDDIDTLPHVLARRNKELTFVPSSRSIHGAQSAVTAAQLALQHTQSASSSALAHHHSSPPSAKQKTEKDKMLAGEPYYPYTTPLIDEREACKAALWRFNNSQNPANGVSREERARLFRSILVPAANDMRRSTNPAHPVGSVQHQHRRERRHRVKLHHHGQLSRQHRRQLHHRPQREHLCRHRVREPGWQERRQEWGARAAARQDGAHCG